MLHNPLSNLKVIEIASVLAGPSVGMFFAENGARVIKIENKTAGGDVTRSWKMPSENQALSTSAYFASVNYRKKYLSADFNNPVEMKSILEEIKDADILIANFKRGGAKKFGLDYDTLKQLNPKLIYGEISGFGESSDRVAYDLILQAESGFMAINGTPGSGPVKMPVALIDLLAGHQLKEGILVSLLNRQQRGKGCKVHVSLYDSAVASLANQASNWLMSGKNPERIGSKHPNIAPYGELFTTLDKKQITLAIGSDQQFSKLCEVLSIPALANDPRFFSNQQRIQNRSELEQLLAEKIEQFNAASLITDLHSKQVPVAVIKSIREVFEDETTQNLVREEFIDGQKTLRVSGTVYRISE